MGADPTFVGFLVAAITTIAGFTALLIRDAISDARKQRDVALAGWQGSTAAVEKLSDALRERNDLIERQMAKR